MVAAHRNAQGHFLKGCAGGPGNPFGKRVAELRARILEGVSNEEWDKIIRQLIEDAKHADPEIRLAARKELLDRAAGRAVQPVAVSGDDQGNLGELPANEVMQRLDSIMRELELEKRGNGNGQP